MKLLLDHQKLLSSRLKALKLDISEYSFANLYLFRELHQYEVLEMGEIFVKGITRDGFKYIMPIFDILNSSLDILRQAVRDVDFLYPIPEKWLGVFSQLPHEVSYSEGDSDYIFGVEKIATYPGRHLDGKRGLVKQFLGANTVRSDPLTSANAKDAFQVLEKWKEHIIDEQVDYTPCYEAIERLEELRMQGQIYFIDNQPVGFIIGEPLNDQMFVIHFSKADVQYKGIYQYMYQAFARTVASQYPFLNWEQDLAKEGLRQSKRSYCPDGFIKKMRVKFL